MAINITDDAVAFIEANRGVVLFCRGGRGRPIGYPMTALAVTPEVIQFTTYAKSAKVPHIRRDPRVCVLAQAAADPGHVGWVSINGTGEFWTPTERDPESLFVGSGDPRVPSGMYDHVRSRLLTGQRLLLRVDIASSTSGRTEALP